MATGSMDNTCRLWDVERGLENVCLRVSSALFHTARVVFSLNGDVYLGL